MQTEGTSAPLPSLPALPACRFTTGLAPVALRPTTCTAVAAAAAAAAGVGRFAFCKTEDTLLAARARLAALKAAV